MNKTIKGPLSGLRQLLSTDGPLKLMKNVFYFMLIAIFVLEIFPFLPWLFGYNRHDEKAKVNFKIYDVTDWTINNSNKHISQYLKR